MRVIVIALLSVLAAACEPAAAPEGPDQTQGQPAPIPESSASVNLVGLFTPVSEQTSIAPGGMIVTEDDVRFAAGVVMRTTRIEPPGATESIAADGPSFAQTYVGPTDLVLEMRKIEGATPHPICGPEALPTYFVFAYDRPVTAVTLLIFTGADAPGETARDSKLCATHVYAPS